MNYKWIFKDLSGKECLEQLKINREIDDSFIDSRWDALPDFSLIKDIDKATNLIKKYIKKNKKIIVYGHDDLDGLTSTYILLDFFKQIMYDNFSYYIPNRMIENHGLQDTFVEKVKEFDADLVITVDGGISSVEAIAKIKNDLNCEVVVTDHHIIPKELPKAHALVNPKFKDSKYPFDMLAGVGVTYALISELAKKFEVELKKSYLIWTVIGSIADKVPLTGVNRILAVKVFSKRYIIENEDENLYYLRKIFEQDSNFTTYKFILFIMGLFSNGRKTGGNHRTTDFLFAPFSQKKKFFDLLDKEKKRSDERYFDLIAFLNKNKPYYTKYHIIYFDKNDDIPYPLLGKAASYYANLYKVPVLFYKEKKDQIVAEGRGVAGFNFVDSFDYCSDILKQYGGHARAAGFYLEKEKIPIFLEKYKEYLDLKKDDIVSNKKINIDIVLNLNDLNSDCINRLRILQPFGKGNPKPSFLIKNTTLEMLNKKLHIDFIPKDIILNEKYDFVLTWINNIHYRIIDSKKL